MAAQDGVVESSPPTGSELPVVPAAPTFRFKYKEANPAPADADPSLWNKCFTAADSRLYNNYGKKAEKSQKARASGETRKLALQLFAERIAQAAKPNLGFSSTTNTTPTQTPPKIPNTTSSVLTSPNTFTNPSAVSTTLPQISPLETNSQRTTPFTMERPTSRDATPSPFVFGTSSSDASKADFSYTKNPTTIADKVKGRGRPAKVKDANMPSASTPLRGFGPTSYGYAEKRKWDDPEASELTDAEKTARVDEKMKNMSMAELIEFERGLVKSKILDVSFFDSKAAENLAAGNTVATLPVVEEEKKASKAKKKRKRAAARKAAEAQPDSPRSPVSPPSGTESSNDGGQYCICRRPDNHRKMIACDACDEWFHCSCVGIDDQDVELIDKYICLSCDEPKRNTTWKPMCRLKGCRNPCNLTAKPPSKYCSNEHRLQWGREQVARMPDGPGPSRGGAITKGELKSLLDFAKGDVKKFHALGKKPTLPEGSEGINLDDFLTSDEKGRLVRIAVTRERHHGAIDGFTKKGEVLKMATARMRKVADGICGWEPLLEKNEEEFADWRNSEAGQKTFETGVLEGPYCDRKHCKTHPAWIKTVSLDLNEEIARLKKSLGKLSADEEKIQERCKLRAAIQNQ